MSGILYHSGGTWNLERRKNAFLTGKPRWKMDGRGEQKNVGFNNLDLDVLTRKEVLELLDTIKALNLEEQDLSTKLEYQKLRVKLLKRMVHLAKELAAQAREVYAESRKVHAEARHLYGQLTKNSQD